MEIFNKILLKFFKKTKRKKKKNDESIYNTLLL